MFISLVPCTSFALDASDCYFASYGLKQGVIEYNSLPSNVSLEKDRTMSVVLCTNQQDISGSLVSSETITSVTYDETIISVVHETSYEGIEVDGWCIKPIKCGSTDITFNLSGGGSKTMQLLVVLPEVGLYSTSSAIEEYLITEYQYTVTNCAYIIVSPKQATLSGSAVFNGIYNMPQADKDKVHISAINDSTFIITVSGILSNQTFTPRIQINFTVVKTEGGQVRDYSRNIYPKLKNGNPSVFYKSYGWNNNVAYERDWLSSFENIALGNNAILRFYYGLEDNAVPLENISSVTVEDSSVIDFYQTTRNELTAYAYSTVHCGNTKVTIHFSDGTPDITFDSSVVLPGVGYYKADTISEENHLTDGLYYESLEHDEDEPAHFWVLSENDNPSNVYSVKLYLWDAQTRQYNELTNSECEYQRIDKQGLNLCILVTLPAIDNPDTRYRFEMLRNGQVWSGTSYTISKNGSFSIKVNVEDTYDFNNNPYIVKDLSNYELHNKKITVLDPSGREIDYSINNYSKLKFAVSMSGNYKICFEDFGQTKSEHSNEAVAMYKDKNGNTMLPGNVVDAIFQPNDRVYSGSSISYYYLSTNSNTTITSVEIINSNNLDISIAKENGKWKLNIEQGYKDARSQGEVDVYIYYQKQGDSNTYLMRSELYIGIDNISYYDWINNEMYIQIPTYAQDFITYTVELLTKTAIESNYRVHFNVDMNIARTIPGALSSWYTDDENKLGVSVGFNTFNSGRNYFKVGGRGDKLESLFENSIKDFSSVQSQLSSPGALPHFSEMLIGNDKNGKVTLVKSDRPEMAMCVAEYDGNVITHKYTVRTDTTFSNGFSSYEIESIPYTYPDNSRVIWLDATTAGVHSYNQTTGSFYYDCLGGSEILACLTKGAMDFLWTWSPIKIKAPDGYQVSYFTINGNGRGFRDEHEDDMTLGFTVYSEDFSAAPSTNGLGVQRIVLRWRNKNNKNDIIEERFNIYFNNYSITGEDQLWNLVSENGYSLSVDTTDKSMSFTYEPNTGFYNVSFDPEILPTAEEMEAELLIKAPAGAKYYKSVHHRGYSLYTSSILRDNKIAIDSMDYEELPEGEDYFRFGIVDYGTYSNGAITAYYNSTSKMGGLVIEWYNANKQLIGSSFIYGRTEGFISETITSSVTDMPEEPVSAATAVVAPGSRDFSLRCTLYPQTGDEYFFSLDMVEPDNYTFNRKIILPYSFIGVENYSQTSGLSAPVITHYNEDMDAIETITGVYTDCGILFSVSSFSPFTIKATQKKYEGNVTDKISYSYNPDSKVMTISGLGITPDYTCEPLEDDYIIDVPWNDIRSDLVTIVVEEGITGIGNNIFAGCQNLKNVILPNSLTSVGITAFWGSGVETLSIPKNVESMDESFKWSPYLANVTVDAANQYYSSDEGVVYSTLDKKLIYFPKNKEGRYEILSGTVSTSDRVFQGASKLTELVIPASLVSMPDLHYDSLASLSAFTVAEDNTAYKSVDGVLYTKDGRTMIYYPQDKKASNYSIPSDVEIVQDFPFKNKYLESISIPSKCMFYELNFSKLTSLKTISVDASNPYYKVVDDVLFSKNGKVMIAYPYAKEGADYHIPNGTLVLAPTCLASLNIKNLYIPHSVVIFDFVGMSFGDSRPDNVYYEGSSEELASLSSYLTVNFNCICSGDAPQIFMRSLGFGPFVYLEYGGQGGYVGVPNNQVITRATIQIKNISYSSDAKIIVNVYDKNGRQVDCRMESLSVPVGQSQTIYIDLNAIGYELKAYIVDSQNKPLCMSSYSSAEVPPVFSGG